MIETTLWNKLLLSLIIGIVLVYSMASMAKRNNREQEPKKHLALKITAGIILILAILCGVSVIRILNKIAYAYTSTTPPLNNYSPSVATSSDKLLREGLTLTQFTFLATIQTFFMLLGLCAYFYLYKSSMSKWWQKLKRIVFCLCLYVTYSASINSNYSDMHEYVFPFLFAVMAYFALRNKHSEDHNIKKTLRPQKTVQPSECNNEDEARDIPQTDISVILDKDENIIEPQEFSESGTTKPKYCRFCGIQLDDDIQNYCKNCGKPL